MIIFMLFKLQKIYICSNTHIMDTTMYFKRYCDIENHTQEKTLRIIQEMDSYPSAGSTGTWVALEKVHGCNYSFLVAAKEKDDELFVQTAKRSGILKPGEDLNNISTSGLLEKYSSCAKNVYDVVKSMTKNHKFKQVTIFGELFGGHYPHPDVSLIKDAKLAQKGVYYTNQNDFYAFDIHDGQTYLDYDICMKIFKQCGFLFAEPLCTGSFQHVFDFPNTFETTLPKNYYDHPSLGPTNLAEGLVLKPIRNQHTPNGKRLILKSKTPTFQEITSKPKGNATKKTEINSSDVEKVWNTLKLYVTKNRLANVESHGFYGKKCIHPFAHDAMKEFLRDEEEAAQLYEKLSKQQQKLIKRRLSNSCQVLVLTQ